jgi:hypothetical protein
MRIAPVEPRVSRSGVRQSRAGKPYGRRVFWPWPALARPSQPAAGMLRPRRLGHGQNPSPQAPFEFSERLLGVPRGADDSGNAHGGWYRGEVNSAGGGCTRDLLAFTDEGHRPALTLTGRARASKGTATGGQRQSGANQKQLFHVTYLPFLLLAITSAAGGKSNGKRPPKTGALLPPNLLLNNWPPHPGPLLLLGRRGSRPHWPKAGIGACARFPVRSCPSAAERRKRGNGGSAKMRPG